MHRLLAVVAIAATFAACDKNVAGSADVTPGSNGHAYDCQELNECCGRIRGPAAWCLETANYGTDQECAEMLLEVQDECRGERPDEPDVRDTVAPGPSCQELAVCCEHVDSGQCDPTLRIGDEEGCEQVLDLIRYRCSERPDAGGGAEVTDVAQAVGDVHADGGAVRDAVADAHAAADVHDAVGSDAPADGSAEVKADVGAVVGPCTGSGCRTDDECMFYERGPRCVCNPEGGRCGCTGPADCANWQSGTACLPSPTDPGRMICGCSTDDDCAPGRTCAAGAWCMPQ